MTVRYYSSVAPPTTLSAGITSGAASIQVGSTTGFPALTPYTLSLDYGTSGEELVQVNSAGGTTLAVTRGIDGTSATSHLAGAVVRHVSSARDFADSRSHENADQEIHGLGPGEEIVGTDKVQTLSNKTLDMADGTLNRVDIFNGSSWVTTVNGDVAFPSTNLMQWKPDGSSNAVTTVANNGTVILRNTAAVDAGPSNYRFRVTATDGTTDNFYVLSGGTIFNRLANGQNGMRIQGSPDNVRRLAYTVMDLDGTTARSGLYTDGTMALVSKSAGQVVLDMQMAPSQTANAIRISNSGGTSLFRVTNLGELVSQGLTSAGPVTGTTATFTGGLSANTIVDSSNGFTVLPVRRGTVNVSFTSLTTFTVAVSYGVTFPNTPSVTTNIASGDGTTSRWSTRAISVGVSGFTLFCYAEGGAGAQTWVSIPVNWIAVSL